MSIPGIGDRGAPKCTIIYNLQQFYCDLSTLLFLFFGVLDLSC